ncbi:MAG: DUF1134 domain-containing protein [Desulfovibrionaceae bacterium]
MKYMLALACAVWLLGAALPARAADEGGTYSKEEIAAEVEGFFEGTTKGLAEVIEKVFKDQGRPVGFIKGGEGGGALMVGLRYGKGTLRLKSGASREVWWQGPSVGFDIGGNASKNFTLVYGMTNPDDIYQRFPGVDGSAYVVGGVGLNYQKSNDIILAPIRTGVGLRLGASVGYVHYTREKSINPF